jgi:hypothetical protein
MDEDNVKLTDFDNERKMDEDNEMNKMVDNIEKNYQNQLLLLRARRRRI